MVDISAVSRILRGHHPGLGGLRQWEQRPLHRTGIHKEVCGQSKRYASSLSSWSSSAVWMKRVTLDTCPMSRQAECGPAESAGGGAGRLLRLALLRWTDHLQLYHYLYPVSRILHHIPPCLIYEAIVRHIRDKYDAIMKQITLVFSKNEVLDPAFLFTAKPL